MKKIKKKKGLQSKHKGFTKQDVKKIKALFVD